MRGATAPRRLLSLLALLLAGVAVFALALRPTCDKPAVLIPVPAGRSSSGTRAVDLTPASDSRRVAVFEPGTAPRGKAVAAASNQRAAAAGVAVCLLPVDPHDMRSYQVKTDGKGRYAFEHIPPGQYWMTAQRPRSGNVICLAPDGKPPGIAITLVDRGHHTQDLVAGN